jgi:hypothetical protein
MNPEAASPHGHVDESAKEEHEQQLLQAAAPVNLINSPAAHRFTHEPYHVPMNFIIMMRMTSTLLVLQQELQVKNCLQVLGICI